jgi:hypothetical protein
MATRKKTQRFTLDEDQYLWNNREKSVKELATDLDRMHTSVNQRMKLLIQRETVFVDKIPTTTSADLKKVTKVDAIIAAIQDIESEKKLLPLQTLNVNCPRFQVITPHQTITVDGDQITVDYV